MCPSFNIRLIVEILNFIALYRTDFGLLWCFTRYFCPQASQICAICVKASPVEIFVDCDVSETCLRHVTRLLVNTLHDYRHSGTILQRSALLDWTQVEC